MVNRVITPETFTAVLEELSKDVKMIMDTPPDSAEGRIAFVLFYNTLKDMSDEQFKYLPEGERDLIMTMCAAWMDVGLLLGKSPQLLADILKRAKAKVKTK
jgi:hypothetical protein